MSWIVWRVRFKKHCTSRETDFSNTIFRLCTVLSEVLLIANINVLLVLLNKLVHFYLYTSVHRTWRELVIINHSLLIAWVLWKIYGFYGKPDLLASRYPSIKFEKFHQIFNSIKFEEQWFDRTLYLGGKFSFDITPYGKLRVLRLQNSGRSLVWLNLKCKCLMELFNYAEISILI